MSTMEGVSRAAGVAVDSLSSNAYVSHHTFISPISSSCLPISSGHRDSGSKQPAQLPLYPVGEIRRDLLRLANQLQQQHHDKIAAGHFVNVDSIVNLEDLLASSSSSSSSTASVSQHGYTHQHSDADNNALLSYLGSSSDSQATSSSAGGCLVQLEPVEQDQMESSAFTAVVESPFVSSLQPDSIAYDHAVLEQRLAAFDDNSFISSNDASPCDADLASSSEKSSMLPRNVTAVPVQIVRPQQHKSSVTTSTTDEESGSSKGVSRSRPSRKRGARTQSMGSSSDEGSVANASSEGSEGCLDGDASKHRRTKQPVPDAKKDEKYWRRRLKNNLAAKRSREARKQKECQTSVRAAFLEEQHCLLKRALDEALQQNEELRKRLSRYENVEDLLPKVGYLALDKMKWKDDL